MDPWIPVIDNAVKIGLGALVGGFFAWLVARHNAKSAIEKLVFERRTKILSETAEIFEAYFQSFLKYSNRLCGIAEASRSRPTKPSVEAFYDSLLAEQANEALKLRFQMSEQMERTFTAQSQLMLLDEEKCLKKAEALYATIGAADESYKFDGKSFSLADWKATSEAVRDARIAFYREMRNAFGKV
jgi:hypothetical protein